MFMEIQYEDIASDPIKMANRIYQFTYSEDAPDKVKQWLNMTNGTYNKELPFSTFRKNSIATSMAWRNKLSKDTVDTIEVQCKDLLKHIDVI